MRKKAKTTKKLVLRLECTECKWKNQVTKRENGGIWNEMNFNFSIPSREPNTLSWEERRSGRDR